MKPKIITSVDELIEKKYFQIIRFSPMGSPSRPVIAMIIQVDQDNLKIINSLKCESEYCSKKELNDSMQLDYVQYSESNQKNFLKDLKMTIKARKTSIRNEIKLLNQLQSKVEKMCGNDM